MNPDNKLAGNTVFHASKNDDGNVFIDWDDDSPGTQN